MPNDDASREQAPAWDPPARGARSGFGRAARTRTLRWPKKTRLRWRWRG